MRHLQPPNWPRPKGYSNGIIADGQMVFVAGQIGWDESETLVSDDFAEQFEQVLVNTLAVLHEAGAGPQHIVRMTGYVTDKQEYLGALQSIGKMWKRRIGRNYPVMAFMEVQALIEDRAKIEIETTAVVPR